MHRTLSILLLAPILVSCKTKEIPPASNSSPTAGPAMVAPAPVEPRKKPVAMAPVQVTPQPQKVATPQKKPTSQALVIPKDPMKKAELFERLGYGRSAFTVLKKHEETLGTTFAYWHLRARAAYTFNSTPDVLAAVKKGLPLARTPAEQKALWLLKGRARFAQRKYPAARRALTKALELAPKDIPTRLSLLEVLAHQRKTTLYRAVLDQGLAMKPDRGEYLLAQGELLALTGKRAKAITHFTNLSRQPKVLPFIRARALDRAGTLLAATSKAKAATLVKECVERFPTFGCVTTEMLIAPPDPRHPNRRIRNVKRSLYSPKKRQ